MTSRDDNVIHDDDVIRGGDVICVDDVIHDDAVLRHDIIRDDDVIRDDDIIRDDDVIRDDDIIRDDDVIRDDDIIRDDAGHVVVAGGGAVCPTRRTTAVCVGNKFGVTTELSRSTNYTTSPTACRSHVDCNNNIMLGIHT